MRYRLIRAVSALALLASCQGEAAFAQNVGLPSLPAHGYAAATDLIPIQAPGTTQLQSTPVGYLSTVLGVLGGSNAWTGANSFSQAPTFGAPLAVTSGGTGGVTATAARTSLGAAALGANSDITSLTGLTTALPLTEGGTGEATAPAALNALSGLPHLANKAALTAAASTAYPIVVRDGYATAGDAQQLSYLPSSSPCPISGGDGGSQIPTSDGKCWLAVFPEGRVDVREFGAKGDGTTNDTAAVVAARNFVATNTALYYLYFPPGKYEISYLPLQVAGFRLRGAGHNLVTLQRLAGSANSVLIDGSSCALGNSAPAVNSVSVEGVTLDGNKANITRPADDTTEWGICYTNDSYSAVRDVVAQNFWNGGVGIFINSNYDNAQGWSNNNGQGSVSVGTEPGLDINASKFDIVDWISTGGDYLGGRILNNSWGDHFKLTVYNPVTVGFEDAAFAAGTGINYANISNVSIVGGASGSALDVTGDVHGDIIHVTAQGTTGQCVISDNGASGDNATGNAITAVTYGNAGEVLCNTASGETYNISSRGDGTSASYTNNLWLLDITGSNNTIAANLQGNSVNYLGGVAFRSGAAGNRFGAFRISGMGTGVNLYQDLNGASTTNLPPTNFQTPAATLTLNSGWSWTGSAGTCYVDSSGLVHLRGVAGGGTGSILTLPAQCWPQTYNVFVGDPGGSSVQILSSTGAVNVQSGSGPYNLTIGYPGANFGN